MKQFSLFTGVAALAISLGTAEAANITITDLDDDVNTNFPTVSVDACPVGVDTCITNVSHFGSDGLQFTFTSDVATAEGQSGKYLTRVLDPAFEGGALSDYVEFTLTDGSFDIGVKVCSSEDLEGGGSESCLPVPEGDVLLPQDGVVEDGLPDLVAQYVYVSGPDEGREIDNFYLASEVAPEPGTLAMLGCGLLGLAGMARRRR